MSTAAEVEDELLVRYVAASNTIRGAHTLFLMVGAFDMAYHVAVNYAALLRPADEMLKVITAWEIRRGILEALCPDLELLALDAEVMATYLLFGRDTP